MDYWNVQFPPTHEWLCKYETTDKFFISLVILHEALSQCEMGSYRLMTVLENGDLINHGSYYFLYFTVGLQVTRIPNVHITKVLSWWPSSEYKIMLLNVIASFLCSSLCSLSAFRKRCNDGPAPMNAQEFDRGLLRDRWEFSRIHCINDRQENV